MPRIIIIIIFGIQESAVVFVLQSNWGSLTSTEFISLSIGLLTGHSEISLYKRNVTLHQIVYFTKDLAVSKPPFMQLIDKFCIETFPLL